MRAIYKDLALHSMVYGLAQVIGRFASLLLLPVYTRYLRPADYGCIAILDLMSGVLAAMISFGMAAAVSRFHFDARDDAGRDRVWWTGFALVLAMATALVAPTWLARDGLARVMLGPGQERGGYYYSLALATLWFNVLAELANTRLRVCKRSTAFLAVSVGRLLVNVGLNVTLLAVYRLGVEGVLIGNLVAGAVNACALTIIFISGLGPFAFCSALAGRILRFVGPLTVTALLLLVMHQADRYILRLYTDMGQVGLYSLAYSLAQGVTALFLLPFSSIWRVARYEIAKQPAAAEIYAEVFGHYVSALSLLMLGVSLSVRPLLALLARPDYFGAADLVPIICLAYVFLGLHEHFEVPALLAKRTMSLLPAAIAGAALNIAATVVLVPRMGAAGAAWATVLTFAAYSSVGLWRYRRIDRYDYPLARGGAVLTGMTVTYVGWRSLAPLMGPYPVQAALAVVLWTAWAVALCFRAVRSHRSAAVAAIRARLVRFRGRALAETIAASEGV